MDMEGLHCCGWVDTFDTFIYLAVSQYYHTMKSGRRDPRSTSPITSKLNLIKHSIPTKATDTTKTLPPHPSSFQSYSQRDLTHSNHKLYVKLMGIQAQKRASLVNDFPAQIKSRLLNNKEMSRRRKQMEILNENAHIAMRIYNASLERS